MTGYVSQTYKKNTNFTTNAHLLRLNSNANQIDPVRKNKTGTGEILLDIYEDENDSNKKSDYVGVNIRFSG